MKGRKMKEITHPGIIARIIEIRKEIWDQVDNGLKIDRAIDLVLNKSYLSPIIKQKIRREYNI